MTFSNEQLSRIPHILSEPRFATYLRYSQEDKTKALALYHWNLELSAAFVAPIHLFEVSVRNAVVEVLEVVHSPDWPWNTGFIRSLPRTGRHKPALDLQKTAEREPTMGKVVAELKFAFWENMFTARHDEKLWNDHLKCVFAFVPVDNSVSECRAAIHNHISAIRILRNRIMHHEPIFSRNIAEDYSRIHEVLSWRDTVTSNWMHEIQQVTKVISEKPAWCIDN